MKSSRKNLSAKDQAMRDGQIEQAFSELRRILAIALAGKNK